MNGYKGLKIPEFNPFEITNRSCCLSTRCGFANYHPSPERIERKKIECPACLFSDENESVFQGWDKTGRPLEKLPVEYQILEVADDPDYDEDEDV